MIFRAHDLPRNHEKRSLGETSEPLAATFRQSRRGEAAFGRVTREAPPRTRFLFIDPWFSPSFLRSCGCLRMTSSRRDLHPLERQT